jgi:hypothetical protein
VPHWGLVPQRGSQYERQPPPPVREVQGVCRCAKAGFGMGTGVAACMWSEESARLQPEGVLGGPHTHTHHTEPFVGPLGDGANKLHDNGVRGGRRHDAAPLLGVQDLKAPQGADVGAEGHVGDGGGGGGSCPSSTVQSVVGNGVHRPPLQLLLLWTHYATAGQCIEKKASHGHGVDGAATRRGIAGTNTGGPHLIWRKPPIRTLKKPIVWGSRGVGASFQDALDCTHSLASIVATDDTTNSQEQWQPGHPARRPLRRQPPCENPLAGGVK